jgi:2,3-dihydroxybiphenyl 1,2-dioxygenase
VALQKRKVIMASVSQLGYLGFKASNLDEWESFGTQILGIESVGRNENGALMFRMDEYQYRFMFEQGAKDDLDLIGWQVEDERALGTVAEQLTAAGIEVQCGSAAEAEARRVVELIKFNDPSGIASEAFYGPLTRIDTAFKPARAISGFVASGMGLGHITMGVDNMEQSLQFYRDVLEMRLSDWVQPQPERDVKSRFNIAFLHCNQRHHSIAFWEARMPKRLHHFMLQLKSLDDVGTTFDLCQQRGVPLELTLGRHTNDRMLSFYVRTPSGFSVEYGWGARTVDDRDWLVQLHRTGSIWGHHRTGA